MKKTEVMLYNIPTRSVLLLNSLFCVLFSFWDENQPAHWGMESCVHLKGSDTVHRKLMHDADCHSQLYHICERKLEKGMRQETSPSRQMHQTLLKPCSGHAPSEIVRYLQMSSFFFFFVSCTCLTDAHLMYFCYSQVTFYSFPVYSPVI